MFGFRESKHCVRAESEEEGGAGSGDDAIKAKRFYYENLQINEIY